MIVCKVCGEPANKIIKYKDLTTESGTTGGSYCSKHYPTGKEIVESKDVQHFDGVAMVPVP